MAHPTDGALHGSWWFARFQAGSVAAQGLRDVLEGTHLEGAELFVREVTQNSVDAADPEAGGPVDLRFRSSALQPDQRRALQYFLFGDGKLSGQAARLSEGEHLHNGAFLADPENAPLRVLFVEDRNTVGLGGTLGGAGPDDHFSRLIYFFGQTHDGGQQDVKGGAYGFGKSVLSVASRSRTVVYYSRPKPTERGAQPSRLIAVSLFPSGDGYTGFALCGSATSRADFPVHPIEGPAADRLASAMGFETRGRDEPGTSIMVVDCDYDVHDLRSAIEKWWWPRLMYGADRRLVVAFERDGRAIAGPDPKARKDLAPFVRAYEHILDRRANNETTQQQALKVFGSREIGTLCLTTLDDVSGDDDEAWYTHQVAMFRGPGLVVEYRQLGNRNLSPFVGVFEAKPDYDGVFRRAEPPAHDHWSPTSNRLDKDEREDTVVRGVERRCRDVIKVFQERLQPKPVVSGARFRPLENLLGRAFKKGKRPGPVAAGDPRPIQLHVMETRNYEHGYDEAKIEIRQRAATIAEGTTLSARVVVEAHLLGDARRGRLESLPVELHGAGGARLAYGLEASHAFEIPFEGKAVFVARATAGVDAAVRFRVHVEGERSDVETRDA